jgi:predicted aspartyl protease
MALDTGASTTLVNEDVLLRVGYDVTAASQRVTMTTGSGAQPVPKVQVRRLQALGRERFALAAIAHTLPASLGIDGLLGLDFVRGTTLTIDFQNGEITLK